MSSIPRYIQTVALREVKCFAFHGYYPEEQLTGIYFMVDAVVTFEPNNDTENLSRTVNYEILNTIVLEEMGRTQKLLETVVKNIMDRIVTNFPFVLSAEIGVKKLNPPMAGQIGHSLVQLSYSNGQ